MVTLTQVRSEITGLLEAGGLRVTDYVGEKLNPPVVVVSPGSPYVESGEDVPFGHHNVNVTLMILSGRGTNKVQSDWVDSTILLVMELLEDWDVTEVSQPGQVTIDTGTYLGAVINIENTVKLGA